MDRTMNDNAMNDPERLLLQRASRRVGMKMGFYTHTLVYVLVNLGLFALNAMSGGREWAIFPLLGWGLGLAIHGIVVLVTLGTFDLRQRMMASELDRLRGGR